MHLIAPLISGVAGAENGTVYLYRRGAAGTYVTYYTTFEGDGATTPTAGITLDANGGGVFYVNEETLCVVKDSTGTTVRSFVAGSAASSVEVISQSFTGTSYTTGQTGASKPLQLSTALDRLYTSFGARDGNVLVGGSSVTLQSVLSGLATLYFNVKSADYGAVGDGVTNDATAIQAAVTAAHAAGGGIVFFPRGTYLINSTITVPSTVSFLGVGPAGSIISTPTGATAFTMSAATTFFTSIEGLRFNVNSNYGVDVSANRLLRITNCYFDIATGAAGALTNAGTGTGAVYVQQTKFNIGSNVNVCLRANTAAMAIHVYACKFVLGSAGGTTPGVLAYGGSVIACEFDVSGMSSGTPTLITFSSAGVMAGAIIACSCGNPAGGTVTAYNCLSGRGADGQLTIGNVWASNVLHSSSTPDATAATYFAHQDFDRDRGRYYVSDDTAAISIDSSLYSCAEVNRTTNGNQTVTLSAAGAPNRDFTLVWFNNHGAGGGTITMAGPVKGLTTFTVNANSVSYYFFKSVHRTTSEYWALIGSAVNQTP